MLLKQNTSCHTIFNGIIKLNSERMNKLGTHYTNLLLLCNKNKYIYNKSLYCLITK